jgi:two-component system LytT family response regulator
MKAILMDDELQGLNALRAKLTLMGSDVQIIATFQDPQVALQQIKTLQPDVLFLDIEMPNMNGFQLLEALRPYSFQVVFVTAYNQYAIKALRMSAFDYLLKPIDIDELRATTTRIREVLQKDSNPLKDERLTHILDTLNRFSQNKLNEKIALATQEGILFLLIKDILRVEAMSNYATFFTLNKQKVIVSKPLKEFEEALIPHNFLRVNRSHLINLNYINRYKKGDGGVLTLQDGYEVEVSPQRKCELIEKLHLLN